MLDCFPGYVFGAVADVDVETAACFSRDGAARVCPGVRSGIVGETGYQEFAGAFELECPLEFVVCSHDRRDKLRAINYPKVVSILDCCW